MQFAKIAVLFLAVVFSTCKARVVSKDTEASQVKSVSTPKPDWMTARVLRVNERMAIFKINESSNTKCFYLYNGEMTESGNAMAQASKILTTYPVTWDDLERAVRDGKLVSSLENNEVAKVQEIWEALEREPEGDSEKNKVLDDTWLANFESFSSAAKAAGNRKLDTKDVRQCPKSFKVSGSTSGTETKSKQQYAVEEKWNCDQPGFYTEGEFTKKSTVGCGTLAEIDARCKALVRKIEFTDLPQGGCDKLLDLPECNYGTTSVKRTCVESRRCCTERVRACTTHTMAMCKNL